MQLFCWLSVSSFDKLPTTFTVVYSSNCITYYLPQRLPEPEAFVVVLFYTNALF